MARGNVDFEEYVRSRSEPPPTVLYKYMSTKTAREVLQNRTLRYQSPLKYNDPFDCQWDPHWPLRTEQYAARQRALLDQALSHENCWPKDMDPEFRTALTGMQRRIASLPPADRASARKDFVERIIQKHPKEMETTAQTRLDLLRRLRVLCMCANDRSILMWSHYAEQHRGVMLGFDSAIFEQAVRRPFDRVAYQSALPNLFDEEACARADVFGLDRPRDDDKNAREWTLSKSDGWKYEREWRSVCVAPKGTTAEFEDVALPGAALVEIALGCRIADGDAEELVKLAFAIQPNVRVVRMSRHPSRFELVTQRSGPGLP